MSSKQKKEERRKWPRHVEGPSCEGCNARLAEGHEELSRSFQEIKKVFPRVHSSWVFRNENEQNQMVIERSSNLKWPKSKHNAMRDGKPESLAMDLFEIDEKGNGRWRPEFFNDIWKLCKAKKLPIKWGVAFKIGDANHFEITEEKK